MSAKNNVNPDHYKLAGRDRPNELIVPEEEKQQMALEAGQAKARRDRRRRGRVPARAAAGKRRQA